MKTPLYTSSILEVANIYIRGNEILKCRGNKFNLGDIVDNVDEIINIYDNVVVEENKVVSIYCKEQHLLELYRERIEFLKNLNLDVKDKFIFR